MVLGVDRGEGEEGRRDGVPRQARGPEEHGVALEQQVVGVETRDDAAQVGEIDLHRFEDGEGGRALFSGGGGFQRQLELCARDRRVSQLEGVRRAPVEEDVREGHRPGCRIWEEEGRHG
jgi:hypothetical protein